MIYSNKISNMPVVFLMTVGLSIGCSSTDQAEPVSEEPVVVASSAEKVGEPQEEILAAQSEPEQVALEEGCRALPEGVKLGQPIVLEDGKIVVTKVLRTCTKADGQAGLEQDTPFTAMGIPCTGAPGVLDWKGHYYAPKLVELHFSNDCGMHPMSKDEVSKYVYDVLQLSAPKEQLMAFNPLAVQYWELPTGEDADVGFSVRLRSNLSKQMLWPMLKKGESIPVILYGRENSWTAGKKFFKVAGEVKLQGTRKFGLEVSKIESLSAQQVEELKNKCYGLTPKRQCSKVFGY